MAHGCPGARNAIYIPRAGAASPNPMQVLGATQSGAPPPKLTCRRHPHRARGSPTQVARGAPADVPSAGSSHRTGPTPVFCRRLTMVRAIACQASARSVADGLHHGRRHLANPFGSLRRTSCRAQGRFALSSTRPARRGTSTRTGASPLRRSEDVGGVTSVSSPLGVRRL